MPEELVARVRRALTRSAELGRTNGAATNGLTPREREVLSLLAEGLTQDEIADRLVISPKTVATHIQRILGKLDVRSRARRAVARAYRLGLVDDVAAHMLVDDVRPHMLVLRLVTGSRSRPQAQGLS